MTTINIIENFNLDEHLPDVEITVESFPRFPDEYSIYKRKQLSDELTLFLYDSGQANIEYKGDTSSDNTILWDGEAAAMIDNINYVSAIELFELMYRKRWDRS